MLIEASVSRLRADTLLVGSANVVEADLDRMVVAKVKQLDGCIGALLKGTAQIPAEAPEIEMSRVERIWPVIVTAGNLTQNGLIWSFLERECDGLLQQPKVQPLTLLDIEDLEQLCGFIEAGCHLPDLLAGKTQEPFRQRELAIWLGKDPQAPRDRPRPALVERVWDDAIERAIKMIDFTKGIEESA